MRRHRLTIAGSQGPSSGKARQKQDADYIFHELTRSICPQCKVVIDAQVIIRDNKVFMRKRCPDHGWFEGIISSDAQMYVDSAKFNKPGTMPLEFSTEVKDGCPLDCGFCPEHKQHLCLALIEVNTACNLNCPVCFANAGMGYSLTWSRLRGCWTASWRLRATRRSSSSAAESLPSTPKF